MPNNDNTQKKDLLLQDLQSDAELNNQKLWDEIASVHFKAYTEVQNLRDGRINLDEIEQREVGEVGGKSLLHLQCHIGTDTLSWARLGACVTGVDFSQQSLVYAKQLQTELKLEGRFIHANVYDLPSLLTDTFDIVYTSRGVLCWLKDLQEWARIIARFLNPGGIFYIMESHPICHIFDDEGDGPLAVKYSYFHKQEPGFWDDDGPDYADPNYHPKHASYEWDWSVGDIINALLQAGLELELFNEYDRTFHKQFPQMVSLEEGQYHFQQYAGMLPLLFTLKARKPQ